MILRIFPPILIIRIFPISYVSVGVVRLPASCPMGTRGSYPGGKRPGREAAHSPPSSAEVRNVWSYTSTPQYVFMVWCLVKHRDNFFLHFTSLHFTSLHFTSLHFTLLYFSHITIYCSETSNALRMLVFATSQTYSNNYTSKVKFLYYFNCTTQLLKGGIFFEFLNILLMADRQSDLPLLWLSQTCPRFKTGSSELWHRVVMW
jgi:hypothetical protein